MHVFKKRIIFAVVKKLKQFFYDVFANNNVYSNRSRCFCDRNAFVFFYKILSYLFIITIIRPSVFFSSKCVCKSSNTSLTKKSVLT